MTRESSATRQAQIKKAVLDIISEEGLHNLSSRNLAKRVGITDGAIFRHFKSMRDIIKNIMDDVQRDLMSRLNSIANSNAAADKRLLLFLQTHIGYLATNRGIAVLLFSEAAHLNNKGLREHLRAILSEQKSLIGKIIRDGITEGIWKKEMNVEDAAILYMGVLIIFNVKLFLTRGEVAVRGYCDRMFRLIMKVLT